MYYLGMKIMLPINQKQRVRDGSRTNINTSFHKQKREQKPTAARTFTLITFQFLSTCLRQIAFAPFRAFIVKRVLEKLMRGYDSVRNITAQKIKWWGHHNKNSKEDYGTESHRNEIKRTSKYRQRDEVFNVLRKLKVKNCTYLVKDRKAWYERVPTSKTHKGLCQQKKKKNMVKTVYPFLPLYEIKYCYDNKITE